MLFLPFVLTISLAVSDIHKKNSHTDNFTDEIASNAICGVIPLFAEFPETDVTENFENNNRHLSGNDFAYPPIIDFYFVFHYIYSTFNLTVNNHLDLAILDLPPPQSE